MDKPRWLNDFPEITAVLHRLLNKRENKTCHDGKLSELRITEKSLPGLYQLNDQASQQWELLTSLSPTICKIIPAKKRDEFTPGFHKARLVLTHEGEVILREWLDRPEISAAQRWQAAVQQHQSIFPGNVDVLLARRFNVAGMNEDEVVQALAAIGDYAQQYLSLRQLSALVFRGDSKVLDNKQELLEALYPQINIKPRPVLVDVYLPTDIKAVLFIENQDSYHMLTQSYHCDIAHTALVYCSGYQGTAERIRELGGASLHYQGYAKLKEQFEQWWFNKEQNHLPVYFWGDLDFAGIAILKVLRQRFEKLQAWRLGYEPMRTLLERGGGYSAKQQNDPQSAGCDYADQILLPLLRKCDRAIDQEVVIKYTDN